jgi:hypothetical protein
MIKRENVVLFDKLGLQSIMVKFTPEEGKEVDPMFIINGETVEAIYLSKYPNTMINGIPCSLPYQKPAADITFDEAVAACRKKGEGWHLMTAIEFEYLIKEARTNGTLPHGNNDCGKDYYHKDEKGETYSFGLTLAGSGPVTWSHDHTEYGVYDLNGNFWEWVSGLRLKKGAIQYFENNDAAADTADLSKDSPEWKTVEVNGKAVNLSAGDRVELTTDTPEEDWTGDHFCDMEIRLEEVPKILKTLGVIPEDWKENKAGIWVDSQIDEAMPLRGSGFSGASLSGVAAVHLNNPRSCAGSNVSFRSAFYVKNGKLID